MTVKEMINRGLLWGGYEGLYNPECECGCTLENLCPCGDPDLNECIGGFKKLDGEGNQIVGPKE